MDQAIVGPTNAAAKEICAAGNGATLGYMTLVANYLDDAATGAKIGCNTLPAPPPLLRHIRHQSIIRREALASAGVSTY